MKKKVENSANINHSLRRIFKTSVMVLIFLFISKILGYLYRIIIARSFGSEAYGIFSLAIMVVGFFVTFSSLGFSDGVLRQASLYRAKLEFKKISYLYTFSLKVMLALGVMLGFLLFITSDYIAEGIFHNSQLSYFLKIFAFLVPISTLLNVFTPLIKAFEKINWYSFIFYILQNVVKVGLLLVLFFIGFNSESIYYSWIFGFISMLLVSYFVCRYKLPQIFIKSDLKEKDKSKIRTNLISYSWPLLFSSIISSIFYWVDSFSLGYFRNASEVGLYNAAIPIATLLAVAPELFIQLFFPLITKEYSLKNMVKIRELSKQVGKWIFMINLPIFIFIVLFPGAIINLFFGASYLEATVSLRILAIGGFISSIMVISNNLLSMVGKSKTILTNILISSIMNLILNIILVPSLGMTGAAISTTLSVIVLNFLFFFQAKKYTNIIPFRRKMLIIALISLIPLFLIIFLKSIIPVNIFTIAVLVILFFIIYYLLISLTGCWDKYDKMIIYSIIDKIRIKKITPLNVKPEELITENI